MTRRESDRVRDTRAVFDRMRAERDQDQRSLFGDDTDAAVESVADHAGPVWKERALEAVRQAALCNTTVTVTDVWSRCQECDTPDRRAIGWALREGHRRGWLTPTGQYRKHPDPCAHSRPLMIWRSRITEFHGTHYVAEERRGATGGGE